MARFVIADGDEENLLCISDKDADAQWNRFHESYLAIHEKLLEEKCEIQLKLTTVNETLDGERKLLSQVQQRIDDLVKQKNEIETQEKLIVQRQKQLFLDNLRSIKKTNVVQKKSDGQVNGVLANSQLIPNNVQSAPKPTKNNSTQSSATPTAQVVIEKSTSATSSSPSHSSSVNSTATDSTASSNGATNTPAVRIPAVPSSPSVLRQPSSNNADRTPSNHKVQFACDNPTVKTVPGGDNSSNIKRKSTVVASDRLSKKKRSMMEEQISRSSQMLEASRRANANNGVSKAAPASRTSSSTLNGGANSIPSATKRTITLNTNSNPEKDHNNIAAASGLSRSASLDSGVPASSSNVTNGTPNPRTPTITPENLSRPLSFNLNKNSNDTLSNSSAAVTNNVAKNSTTTATKTNETAPPLPPPTSQPIIVKQESECNQENKEKMVIELLSEDEEDNGSKAIKNDRSKVSAKPVTEDVKPSLASLFPKKVELKYTLGRFLVQPCFAPKSKKIVHSVSNVFNFDDQYLYVGLSSGPMKRINMTDPKDAIMFNGGKEPVFASFYLRELGRVYAVGIDGIIRWFDVKTGILISSKNAKTTIMCMERSSPSSLDFTVGLNDGSLWRFDASKDDVVDQFKVSSHAIVNVFHIDRNNLLYCEDSCLYKFNWETKKVVLLQRQCRWPTVIRIYDELLYVLHMMGQEQNAMHLITFDLKTLNPKNTIQFESFYRNFFMLEDKIYFIGLKNLIQCFSITNWELVFSAYYLENEILSAWLLNSKTLLIGDNQGYLDSIDLDLSNIKYCDRCNIPFLRPKDLEHHLQETRGCQAQP